RGATPCAQQQSELPRNDWLRGFFILRSRLSPRKPILRRPRKKRLTSLGESNVLQRGTRGRQHEPLRFGEFGLSQRTRVERLEGLPFSSRASRVMIRF